MTTALPPEIVSAVPALKAAAKKAQDLATASDRAHEASRAAMAVVRPLLAETGLTFTAAVELGKPEAIASRRADAAAATAQSRYAEALDALEELSFEHAAEVNAVASKILLAAHLRAQAALAEISEALELRESMARFAGVDVGQGRHWSTRVTGGILALRNYVLPTLTTIVEKFPIEDATAHLTEPAAS